MKRTRYKGSEEEARALGVYVKLMRAAESVTARIHRRLDAVGLTISQFGVMEALYHLGPLAQIELGKKILKTSGNITMVIDNLEKRGLVRRQRSREDRRYVTVHLTGAGEKLIRAFFPVHAARIIAEMSILTVSEQEQLGQLCRKLGRGKEAPNES